MFNHTPDLDPTDAADYLRRTLADSPPPRRSGLLPAPDRGVAPGRGRTILAFLVVCIPIWALLFIIGLLIGHFLIN